MLSSLLSLLFSLLPFQINVPSQVGAKEKLREGGASCLLVSKDFTRGGCVAVQMLTIGQRLPQCL